MENSRRKGEGVGPVASLRFDGSHPRAPRRQKEKELKRISPPKIKLEKEMKVPYNTYMASKKDSYKDQSDPQPFSPKDDIDDEVSLIDQIQRKMARRAERDNEEGETGVFSGGGLGGQGWRRGVLDSFSEGDVQGMIAKAAPVAQMSVIQMATEAEDERVRLTASQHILAQAGHGAIAKVENRVVYENLPEEQLTAMVMSKIKRIGEHKPEVMERLKSLLPKDVIEVEASDGE